MSFGSRLDGAGVKLRPSRCSLRDLPLQTDNKPVTLTLTFSLTSSNRERKWLICKVPVSDHLLQLAFHPSGRFGKERQQIQSGQRVIRA
jgi:hypothetical protein